MPHSTTSAPKTHVQRSLRVLFAAVSLWGCGGTDTVTPPPIGSDPVVASVSLTPVVDTLAMLDATAVYTAVARDAVGGTITGKSFTWSTADDSVASVNGTGVVTANANGSTSVTAMTDGVSGSATIHVLTNQARIPSSGTTVSAAGDTVRIQVPAGAVSNEIVVTVDPTNSFPPSQRVVAGTVFDLGPDGTTFDVSATLTIRYDPAVVPVGQSETDLALYELVGADWQGVTGSAVDDVANSVSGSIDGFSVYGILAPPMNVIDSLVAEAIGVLEDNLFIGINDMIRAEPFALANVDVFSFQQARELFQEAHDIDPDHDVAAFGLAVTKILSLEDEPSLRAAADSWEAWTTSNDVLKDLTGGVGPFPQTLAEQQDLLEGVVYPVLQEALDLLLSVESTEFRFDLTPRMQGHTPPAGQLLELDRTEVLGLISWVEAALATVDIAQAYEMAPSPYGAAAFDDALLPGSGFLTLAPDGQARLTNARDRVLEAVSHAQQALDFLESETDDQSDDVLQLDLDNMFNNCEELPCGLDPQDLQVARDILADLEGMVQGPRAFVPDVGAGEVLGTFLRTTVVVDGSRFVSNPILDLKSLWPSYETQSGEPHWTALSFDEWLFPDPMFGGILPDMVDSKQLKAALDLDGAWNDLNYEIDIWNDLTVSAIDGGIYAVSERGNVLEVASDFSAVEDRPDLTFDPVDNQYGNQFIIDFHPSSGEVHVLDPLGRLWTRPDDASTAWTQRVELLICCWQDLAHSPASASTYALVRGNSHVEVSADFVTVNYQLPLLPYNAESMLGNDQTGELVTLSYDGVFLSRPADAASPWVQEALTLPFGEAWWMDIAQNPLGGTMFAVSGTGEHVEVTADFGTSTARPPLPASNVVALARSTVTNELVAMTADGRLFTRPPDATTPWTARFTLPRVVVAGPAVAGR